MVPGSILGGVIGWATQRYGTSGRAARRGDGDDARDRADRRERVRRREHDHAADHERRVREAQGAGRHVERDHASTPDGPKTTVEYRVTAGGSVVMETMFAGEPHEMITMYTVDGDSLVATHYCSGGNQPVLKLNAAKSTADELVFDFVSVTGTHTHDATSTGAHPLQRRRQGRGGVEHRRRRACAKLFLHASQVTRIEPRATD